MNTSYKKYQNIYNGIKQVSNPQVRCPAYTGQSNKIDRGFNKFVGV